MLLFIGSIVCVIGGILFIYAGIVINPINLARAFTQVGEIVLDAVITIVALIVLKYHFGGILFCFFIGLFALMISFVTSLYIFSLPGPLITIIGSMNGLIGVFLISPKETKKFGICIIFMLIIYFICGLYLFV